MDGLDRSQIVCQIADLRQRLAMLESALLIEGGASMPDAALRSESAEWKHVEAERQESEARWKLLREQLPCIVWTTDKELRVTSSDGAGLADFGLTSGQLVGLSLHEIHKNDPDAGEYITPQLRALEGEATRREMHWRGRILRSYIQPLRDNQDGIIGVIGLTLDITEQKNAEEALETSRRRFQAIFENSLDAMLLTDDSGGVVDNNPAACQLLGYSSQDLLGMNISDLTPVQDRARVPEFFCRLLAAGTLIGELRMLCQGGTIRDAEYRFVANIVPGVHLWTYRDVTDRKRAEETLRKSERRLADAQRVAHIGYWERDFNADQIIWSDELYRIAGLRPQEGHTLKLADLMEVIHPEDRQTVNRAVNEAISGGRRYDVEYRLVRRDGGIRFVHSQGDVVSHDPGQPCRMFGTLQDITDRKQAQEALRVSEEMLRRAQAIAHVGSWLLDMENGAFVGSEECYRICGFDPGPHRPEELTAIVHPDDLALTLSAWQATLTGESYAIDHRLIIDGEVRWVSVRAEPEVDAEGRVVRVRGVSQDITDRKRGEEALRQSHTLLNAVVEGIGDAFYVKDVSGRYLMVNSVAAHHIGRSIGEIIGKDDRELLGPIRAAPIMKRDQQVMTNGESQTFEETVRLSDVDVTFLSKKSAYRDGRGAVMGLLGISRDITARRRAEDHIRERQSELAHAWRLSAMGEMASCLAHELNQPLTAIGSYIAGAIRRLEAKACSSASLGEVLIEVRKQVVRAGEIVRRMRNFVRRREPRWSSVDLNDVAGEALALAEPETRLSGTAVEMQLANDLPPLKGDRIQLEQVVLNLVRNGLEAMSGTEPSERKLAIRTSAQSEEIELSVTDFGCGVPSGLLPRLGEPFFTTKPGGLGLGLSISRSIVEAHNGRLWVSSNQPRGVTLHVTFSTDRAPPTVSPSSGMTACGANGTDAGQ